MSGSRGVEEEAGGRGVLVVSTSPDAGLPRPGNRTAPTMSHPAPLHPIPVDRYLAEERDGTVRHEYVDGQLFAMTGARRAHNTVVASIARLLGNALAGGPCRIAVADMKVQVAPGRRYYYPDVVVSCDDADDEPDEYTETRPTLIVEVLSPTTASTDRREKRVAYLAMASLHDYLIVDPDTGDVEHLSRRGDVWSASSLHAPHDVVELASFAVTLSLAEVFGAPPAR